MQLDPKEEQLLHACRKEERSWKPWALASSVTGYGFIGLWLLLRHSALMGDSAIVLLCVAFYLIEAGVNHRREHSLRELLLKLSEQK